MADFYGSHFEYGGIISNFASQSQTLFPAVRGYGLILVSAGTERMTRISGDISGVTVFRKKQAARTLIDNDYSDFPITFEIDIVTDNDSCIPVNDRRLIERWLFNSHNYRKLYIDPSDDCDGEMSETIGGATKRLYLNCRFMNAERLEFNGGIVGYHATLEADSGLWWQDAVTTELITAPSGGWPSPSATETVLSKSVSVDTDLPHDTYPKVTITVGSSGVTSNGETSYGYVSLLNSTFLMSETSFYDLRSNNVIVLDGNTNYVSGQYYEKMDGRHFPRMQNGTNTFTIRYGNCVITSIVFEFNNRRML